MRASAGGLLPFASRLCVCAVGQANLSKVLSADARRRFEDRFSDFATRAGLLGYWDILKFAVWTDPTRLRVMLSELDFLVDRVTMLEAKDFAPSTAFDTAGAWIAFLQLRSRLATEAGQQLLEHGLRQRLTAVHVGADEVQGFALPAPVLHELAGQFHRVPGHAVDTRDGPARDAREHVMQAMTEFVEQRYDVIMGEQ